MTLPVTLSKFENKLNSEIPNTSSHSLYKIKLIKAISLPISLRYPERNLNVNQLPNVSIGLSPLNSNQTIDLHVITASYLHQNFSWLCTVQDKFNIFRVPSGTLERNPSTRKSRLEVRNLLIAFASLSENGFSTLQFAYMLDSLVRVSRRVWFELLINFPLSLCIPVDKIPYTNFKTEPTQVAQTINSESQTR